MWKFTLNIRKHFLTQNHVRLPDIVPREGVETLSLGTQGWGAGAELCLCPRAGSPCAEPPRGLRPQQGRLWAGSAPTARALGGRPPPKLRDGASTLLSRCQTPESNRADRASLAIDFFRYKIGTVCFLGQVCVSVAMHRFTLSWETSGVVNQENKNRCSPIIWWSFLGNAEEPWREGSAAGVPLAEAGFWGTSLQGHSREGTGSGRGRAGPRLPCAGPQGGHRPLPRPAPAAAPPRARTCSRTRRAPGGLSRSRRGEPLVPRRQLRGRAGPGPAARGRLAGFHWRRAGAASPSGAVAKW